MVEEEISTQELTTEERITTIGELPASESVADSDKIILEHTDGGTESATVQQLKSGLETTTHASNTYSKKEVIERFTKENGCTNQYSGDLNNITVTSLYNIYKGDCSNVPFADNWGFVLTMVYNGNSDYAEQTVFPMNSADKHIYTRTKAGGTWGVWKKLYNETPFSTTFVTSGTGGNYLDLDLSGLANSYGRTIIEESSLTYNYSFSFSNGDVDANGAIIIGYGHYTSLGYNKIRIYFNQNCSGAIRINYTAIPLF